MARRRRKDEEPEWTPPEFDEVDYMRREIESAKVAVVTIAWAVVGALIAYLLYVYVHPAVGFLVGVAAFGALYFLLPILGLPIKAFKTKDWIGHASIYLFSWLAFSIIILNPPFGDHTPPTVQIEAGGSFNGLYSAPVPANTVKCTNYTGGALTFTVQSNQSMYLVFRATDNVAVRSINVTYGTYPVTAAEMSLQPNGCITGSPDTKFAPGTYIVRLPTGSPYTSGLVLAITAIDTSGLASSESVTVQYS